MNVLKLVPVVEYDLAIVAGVVLEFVVELHTPYNYQKVKIQPLTKFCYEHTKSFFTSLL